jgi:squalene-hopene/tetraprenyl-beta-curcumene cyclase
MIFDDDRLDHAIRELTARLLERRAAADHWDGRLSSSSLSTATAVLALHIAAGNGFSGGERLRPFVESGTNWLLRHQNNDGGWGDTDRSRSNISTTAIVWATLSKVGGREKCGQAIAQADTWLQRAAGGTSPRALSSAILKRYGKDKTFSVPILTVLALTGRMGRDATAGWRSIPQLPFELAALPHSWFGTLRLPVVSYALPALIAIGQVRHQFAPSRNPVTRLLRNGVRQNTHRLLRAMLPESGGYLEATPLTSFVVMSLAGMGWGDSPVVEAGVRFLIDSIRDDGSWPIDTNLSTWITTLSIGAVAQAGGFPEREARLLKTWVLAGQSRREHPFTHAAPGAWAWTPLSGGVPDSDDTSGALVALRQLGEPDSATIAAASAGARWLLDVQNRDGGIPTFCRGWGALPFDRSTPEITAHALRGWSGWHPHVDARLARDLRAGTARAVQFLSKVQLPDGSWNPLWFGNEHVDGEDNPVYGTARTLLGLQSALAREQPLAGDCRRRAVRWLLRAQNHDGGWGGGRGVASSVEETGVAVAALGRSGADRDEQAVSDAVSRGAGWLIDRTAPRVVAASPIGLYFARLWYYEDTYPTIFALEGLIAARTRRREAMSSRAVAT